MVCLGNSARGIAGRLSSCGAKKVCLVQVQDDVEAELVVTLLRFLEIGGDMTCTDSEILPLILLADKFGIDSAIAACSTILCRDLTIDKCCACLELPDSVALNDSCRFLIHKCLAFVISKFKVMQSAHPMHSDPCARTSITFGTPIVSSFFLAKLFALFFRGNAVFPTGCN